MSKVAVIYWSGTGHTEAMAEAVAKGADGVLLTCAEVPEDVAAQYDAFALGCPAMGARSWRRTNSARCLRSWLRLSRSRRLLCSAPMAGATANGCALGKTTAVRLALCWPVTV